MLFVFNLIKRFIPIITLVLSILYIYQLNSNIKILKQNNKELIYRSKKMLSHISELENRIAKSNREIEKCYNQINDFKNANIASMLKEIDD